MGRAQTTAPHETQLHTESEQKTQGGGAEDETKVSSQMFSSLIPPPTTLISETIGRYKDKEFMENYEPKEVAPKKEPKDDEEAGGSESAPLHRVSPYATSEVGSLSSTHFSLLPGANDVYFF